MELVRTTESYAAVCSLPLISLLAVFFPRFFKMGSIAEKGFDPFELHVFSIASNDRWGKNIVNM